MAQLSSGIINEVTLFPHNEAESPNVAVQEVHQTKSKQKNSGRKNKEIEIDNAKYLARDGLAHSWALAADRGTSPEIAPSFIPA